MQLTYEEYLNQLEAEHVQVETAQTTAAKVQEEMTIIKALKFIEDQLASGYLVRYEWTVKMPVGASLSIRLETNLVNIPMAEAKRLDPKLLDRDKEYQVNVYMVAEGEDLNKSGLRIDELAAGDDFTSATGLVNQFQAWVADQLAMTTEHRQDEEA